MQDTMHDKGKQFRECRTNSETQEAHGCKFIAAL